MSDGRVWTVYRYYDAAGYLLYIGLTGQGMGRSDNHRRAAAWWPEVARGEFEHFTSAAKALRHETALITRLTPRHNRAENPTYQAPLRVRRPRQPDPNRPRLTGLGGPKRRQVEAYLAQRTPDQLARLTAREAAADLTDAGMDVSERWVARILDEWNVARRPAPARQRRGRG